MTLLALLATWSGATIDSIYFARETLGVRFYWTPIDPVRPDTVGWKQLCGRLSELEANSCSEFSGVVFALEHENWRLYHSNDCTALGLALLLQQNVEVHVLSQWHGATVQKFKLSRPGMSQKEMRQTVISDFHWELPERAAIDAAPSKGADFPVRIYFRDRGHSEYNARDKLVKQSYQVAGGGLSVRLPEIRFEEDIATKRTLFDVWVVLPAKSDPSTVVKAIEREMDRRKLDLSYKAPTLTPITAPTRRNIDTVQTED